MYMLQFKHPLDTWDGIYMTNGRLGKPSTEEEERIKAALMGGADYERAHPEQCQDPGTIYGDAMRELLLEAGFRSIEEPAPQMLEAEGPPVAAAGPAPPAAALPSAAPAALAAVPAPPAALPVPPATDPAAAAPSLLATAPAPPAGALALPAAEVSAFDELLYYMPLVLDPDLRPQTKQLNELSGNAGDWPRWVCLPCTY